jgi:hypothetical protein
MRKLAFGCLGLVVAPILLLVVIGFVVTLARTVSAQQAPTLAAPTRIADWSSTGDLTTQPITITGSSVRLDLTVSQAEKYAQVCVTLKRIDGQWVRGECRQTSGPTYLHIDRPGRYYLEVSAIGSWSMTATDQP